WPVLPRPPVPVRPGLLDAARARPRRTPHRPPSDAVPDRGADAGVVDAGSTTGLIHRQIRRPRKPETPVPSAIRSLGHPRPIAAKMPDPNRGRDCKNNGVTPILEVAPDD